MDIHQVHQGMPGANCRKTDLVCPQRLAKCPTSAPGTRAPSGRLPPLSGEACTEWEDETEAADPCLPDAVWSCSGNVIPPSHHSPSTRNSTAGLTRRARRKRRTEKGLSPRPPLLRVLRVKRLCGGPDARCNQEDRSHGIGRVDELRGM